MFYLIQEDTWSERNYSLIIEAMDQLKMEYEVCRFIPFIHEIEFKTERKDVWCFGAVKMAHIAQKYGFNPGSMYNENHDFEIYAPMYGGHLLNHGGICMDFAEPLPEGEEWEIFIARPTKDTKVFSGQVFMRHSWEEYVAHVKENNTVNIISDNTRVLISPLKQIYQEIRCWAVGGRIVTMSQYKTGTRVKYQNLDYDGDALAFVQRMVAIYHPARAFVMDICRVEEGFKIIEINCINCSGFYDMDFKKLILSLEEEFG